MTMLIFGAANSVQGFCFLLTPANPRYLSDSHVDEVRGHIRLCGLLLHDSNVCLVWSRYSKQYLLSEGSLSHISV